MQLLSRTISGNIALSCSQSSAYMPESMNKRLEASAGVLLCSIIIWALSNAPSLATQYFSKTNAMCWNASVIDFTCRPYKKKFYMCTRMSNRRTDTCQMPPTLPPQLRSIIQSEGRAKDLGICLRNIDNAKKNELHAYMSLCEMRLQSIL